MSSENSSEWWRDAVVYQIYVRSFRDESGDGIGDLAGVRAGLEYLSALGVDAIWLNPIYRSPQRDHGYDISNYFEIDPAYGSVADLTALVEEAHALGIRVVMDMVANHSSWEHPWFEAALASAPGSAERERYIFRDGRGDDGEFPPNNWQSVFGGPAWTRVSELGGSDRQWYFHSFDSGQPDFNWRHPDVHEHFKEVLAFWFDAGVDGFRIDVAHGHVKASDMPDWPGADDGTGGHNYAMWDQPEVHDIYRSWRAIGGSYEESKYFVGEIWVPDADSLKLYLRPDELNQAFSFDLLVQPWSAPRFRSAIAVGLAQAEQTGAPAWVLANHDVHRAATRYGQIQDLGAAEPTDMIAAARRVGAFDLELGTRRSVAATALLLALPGTAYIYQGEELGLPEVLDLPDEVRQDPIWLKSEGRELGRDGCRVPLPWHEAGPSFGFTSLEAAPWLPQPKSFGALSVNSQQADPVSPLNIHRQLIAARRDVFGSSDHVEWLPLADSGLLAISRGGGVCVVNFADEAKPLDTALRELRVVLSTAPDAAFDGTVAANSAIWLALEPANGR